MKPTSNCVIEYISQGDPCPCHPEASAIMIEVMKKVVQEYLVPKVLKQLIRQIIDDELVLSEEIITEK